MNAAPASSYQLSLAQRGIFEVSDASAVRVDCRRGSLWITLDNDPRDFVLEAGQSFATGEHRRALIYALEASSLCLRAVGEQRSEAASIRLALEPALA